MSTNPTDWERVVRERARLIQRNIASLRRWADAAGGDRAERDAAFEILASSSFAKLDEITFEDLPLARLLDRSELVMRIEGDAVAHAQPVRASLVSRSLTNVQQSVSRIVREMRRGANELLHDLVDLSFVGTAPGSLYIGFATPRSADLALPFPEAADLSADIHGAVLLLAAGTQAVVDESALDAVVREFPDPRVRDAVLASVHQLAPTQGSGVSRVGISGRESRAATMTTETRRSSKLLLSETASRAKERMDVEGVVREIDLDERRFELRGIAEIGSLRCAYRDVTDDDAKAWVDARVRVVGLGELDRSGKPALLWASDVSRVDGAPARDSSRAG